MRQLFVIILLISLSVAPVVEADSIWDEARGPVYGVQKRRIRVGDVVTVLISESTQAAQQASTRTQKDASIGTNITDNWIQVANLLGNDTVRKRFQFQLGGNDDYQGAGQTSRQSNVRAVVTSVVTEILDSGNLFIIGEHQVKVNNEVETVRVSGIVRVQDITAQNTVMSSQIAKAEVSVNGSGVVAAKQNPGVLSKMFSWVF